MCLLRTFVQAVFTVMVIILFIVTVPLQANASGISWYTGGKNKLQLNPISSNTPSSLVFSGRTTQKKLMVTIAKNGGNSRSVPIPLSAQGIFNVRYLIKDGSGNYTITFFGKERKDSSKYQGLAFLSQTITENDPADIPEIELNDKILQFVDRVHGSKVGRGECWDLAQEALDSNLADWTRPLAFGQPLDPDADEIKAGDIIQIRNLKISEHLPNNVTRTESLGAPDHTAVIYKVLGKKHFTLAHQNVKGKRTVDKSDVNFNNAISGQYWIYRPVALMIQQ